MADKEIIKITKDYLNELLLAGIKISCAFLYGSHSRETATSESDIDLLIVSPLFDDDIDQYLPKIWLSKIRTQNRIEPFLVGEKRFIEDDVSPLLEIIKKEGIEIKFS